MARAKREEELLDQQLAKVAWATFEGLRPLTRRRSEAYRISDFLLLAEHEPKEEQTVDEQYAMVKLLNALFGGEDRVGEVAGDETR